MSGRAAGASAAGNMTIGATAATPSIVSSARSCSAVSNPPRVIPLSAPVPAPLTVTWPVAKSRPPSTSRLIFSESAPSRTRAATPMAMPPVVSALRTRRRLSSRSAWRTASMARSGL